MDWEIVEDTVAGHDSGAIAEAKLSQEHVAAQLLSTLTARERTVIRLLSAIPATDLLREPLVLN